MTVIKSRTKEFKRNKSLEELLFHLNNDLQTSEQQLLSNYKDRPMMFPLVLIMGPLRSGTTLFSQWLANTGLVSYPSNLLSRFYQAPILGAKIQLLLTDPRYNFRDELGEFYQQCEYHSENGKTKGALAPNEFWFFWRRFLSNPSQDIWTDNELNNTMDVLTMKSELIGVMDVFQKSFAAKGMLFNYNIPFLDSVFEKILFIQMKRNPIANVESVLEARKRQFGDSESWYSFKIPEFAKLKDLDSVSQAAGQIHYINKAITEGIAKVNGQRKLILNYEDFCANPKRVFNQVITKLKAPKQAYLGPKNFKISRVANMHKVRICSALESF